MSQKLREAAAEADVENKINFFLNTETGQKIIEDKIDQISASPEGQLVESMDINVGLVHLFVTNVTIRGRSRKILFSVARNTFHVISAAQHVCSIVRILD